MNRPCCTDHVSPAIPINEALWYEGLRRGLVMLYSRSCSSKHNQLHWYTSDTMVNCILKDVLPRTPRSFLPFVRIWTAFLPNWVLLLFFFFPFFPLLPLLPLLLVLLLFYSRLRLYPTWSSTDLSKCDSLLRWAFPCWRDPLPQRSPLSKSRYVKISVSYSIIFLKAFISHNDTLTIGI